MYRFIKNNEVVWVQEEVKILKSQLKKLLDEFPLAKNSRNANHVEDSNVNVISNGELDHLFHEDLESNRGSEAAGIDKEDIVDANDNESI